jgi:hypothetical protein
MSGLLSLSQYLINISVNMIPKQREMDGIVKQIYEAMMSLGHLQSTMLILCGDHGMNDAGNHGASSAGETSPAMIFISPKMKSFSPGLPSPLEEREDFQYYGTVEQSDLAPTLGALLGFPVPKNNLGACIPDLLPLWPDGGHDDGPIDIALYADVRMDRWRQSPTTPPQCTADLGCDRGDLWFGAFRR